MDPNQPKTTDPEVPDPEEADRPANPEEPEVPGGGTHPARAPEDPT